MAITGVALIGINSNYVDAMTSNTLGLISMQENETVAAKLEIVNDSGNNIVTVDPNSAPDISSSIVLGSDGLPVIAYYDFLSSHLKVIHCGNIDCTMDDVISTLVPENSILHQLVLVIDSDGFPIMGYQDFHGQLKILHCGSVDCSQGNVLTVVDSSENVGQFLSMTIGSDGLPIMSYYDFPHQHLKIAHCGKIDCTEGNYLSTLDSKEYGGVSTSIAIGKDGFPVIAFSGWPLENPKIMHCLTIICSKNTIVSINQSITVATYSKSLAVGGDGLPVVSYYGGPVIGTSNLEVLHCGNPDCSNGNTMTTVDSSTDSGQRNSLMIDKNGLPVIAYIVTPSGFKIVHCGNSECSAGNSWANTKFTGVSDYSSMTLDRNGLPILIGVTQSYSGLGPSKIIHCGKVDCSKNIPVTSLSHENNTLWYIGKSVKPGMYVKYKILDNDTNHGNPYEMTLFFKEYDSDKKYWNVTVYVTSNDKIISGTFYLSDANLSVLESSTISDVMKPYKESYSRTLDSLALIVGKPGQSLSAFQWCPELTIAGMCLQAEQNMKNVTVTGGIFPCKVLTNKLYTTNVNQDMPYPISGHMDPVGVITNPNTPYYEYELLEVGQGYQKIPEFSLAIPILLIGIVSVIAFYKMISRNAIL